MDYLISVTLPRTINLISTAEIEWVKAAVFTGYVAFGVLTWLITWRYDLFSYDESFSKYYHPLTFLAVITLWYPVLLFTLASEKKRKNREPSYEELEEKYEKEKRKRKFEDYIEQTRNGEKTGEEQ